MAGKHDRLYMSPSLRCLLSLALIFSPVVEIKWWNDDNRRADAPGLADIVPGIEYHALLRILSDHC